MKSTMESLIKRGYIDDKILKNYSHYSPFELKELLNSDKAYERSIACRLMLDNFDFNDLLLTRKMIELLKVEKALYTRIEICQLLERGNLKTCDILMEYLGGIGDNQHHLLPDMPSKKKCYPLPRDLIARVMGNMKPENLINLMNILNSQDDLKISEGLDAIGLMIFNHRELSTLSNFERIKNFIENNSLKELIFWKSVTCLSAFKLEECKAYLNRLKAKAENKLILKEIERSLNFIK